MGNKSKQQQQQQQQQMGLYQTKKLLHSKGNHKQNEKSAYQMEEYICKWYIQ